MLAVIGSELIGGSGRNDWAVLNALIAANGPASVEVRVMALVNGPARRMVPGSPLGRAVTKMAKWNAVPAESYSPSESARGRLERALVQLRSLGVRASGDIEPGNPFRAVRLEARRGGYDRVVVLEREDRSWPRRLRGVTLAARLRRGLDLPVDSPGRRDLAPPR